MTQNQISFANVRENIRHNRAQEALNEAQNQITKEHYTKQDEYTGKHYERSDTAGLISANASAMNAVQKKREMDLTYDIEYGWNSDPYFPSNMPLSAQERSVKLDNLIMSEDSPVPSTRLMNRKTKAEILETGSNVLNKVVGSTTSILNSVFGKSGIIAAIKDFD